MEEPGLGVEYRALGPLEVLVAGQEARLGSAKLRLMLAALLVQANAVVSADRLVDILWGDEPPATATTTVQSLVYRLRRLLTSSPGAGRADDMLVTRAPGYALVVEASQYDVARFEQLLADARREAEPASSLATLDEALGLWRGAAFEEVAFDDFARTAAARLEELRMGAIEDRVEIKLGFGQHGELVGELEQAVTLNPVRERVRAQLMLALYRCGREADALQTYQNYRLYLAEELGLEPSAGLHRLEEQILQHDPGLDWAAPASESAAQPVPPASSLPTGTVTFLFTDVEGSTRLWDEHPAEMKAALARHDVILRDAVAAHQGHIVKTTGDGVHAVFSAAADALAAAAAAQVALRRERWDAGVPLQVRMGVHTCEAELREGDYYGSAVNRSARLMTAAHGGQIVVSLATSEVAHGSPVELVDLGEHRLPDLARPERVFQVVHPDLPREFPALRSLDAFPTNLPLQLTAFVGRTDELTEVESALDSARVVTLTGIGGVGKTRVALEVAARVLARYRDGAWLCSLAPVGDPAAVVEVIASALGVGAREGQTIEESLADFLRVKQLLLVLDNCEHLLDAVAGLVDRLVRSCPRITVLATSREGLALHGERILALPSLSVPDLDASTDEAAAADAVRLFVERAADARAGFALRDDNAAAIVQICRRLDGIPLAIELAAARVQAMTPAEIAARLDDQFRLLRGGRRGAVERHQTLRHAIDWSYDLLSDDERLVLERLSVFAGGCSLDDAESVVGGDGVDELDVLEHLSALVRRSLVLADDHEGHTRYRLLETVRQYAHERLEQSGAADAVQRRHAVHYAAFAEEAGRGLRGADQLAWIARVTTEMDNLRVAQAWAIDQHELDLALTILLALCVPGTVIGHAAYQWASALADDPGIDTRPLGPALLAQVVWHAAIGLDPDRAAALDARRLEAAAALGLPPSPADCRASVSIAGTPADVADNARRWVDLARAAGDRYETVQGLTFLAMAMVGAQADGALLALQECVAEARDLANPSSLSLALVPLGGFLVMTDGRQMESVPIFEESIQVGIASGNYFAAGSASTILGFVYVAVDDQLGALRSFRRAIDLHLAIGGGHILVDSFVGIAIVLAKFGDDESAAVLQGASDAIALPHEGPVAEARELLLTALRDRLGDERLTELLAVGASMTEDEAVPYAHASLDPVEASSSPEG